MRLVTLLCFALLLTGCSSKPPLTDAEYEDGARAVVATAKTWADKPSKDASALKEAHKQGEALQERARGTPIADRELFKNVSLLTSMTKMVAEQIDMGVDWTKPAPGTSSSYWEAIRNGIFLVETDLPKSETPKAETPKSP